MDPPFPPPELPPPAPPADPDQEPSSSPNNNNESSEEEDDAAAAERTSLTEAAAIHTIGEGAADDEESRGGVGHHSMPNLEEARTEGAICAGGAYNKKHYGVDSLFGAHFLKGKRGLVLTGLMVCALVLIVGFSVAISQNNKVLSANSSSSSGIEPEDPSLSSSRMVSRLDEVHKFLSHRISEMGNLQDPTTPEYKASLWIADQDTRDLPVPTDPDHYDSSYEFVQRYILAVVYFSLDGANWTKKLDFLSEKSECDWHVDLDPEAMPDHEKAPNWKFGVQCTPSGAVSHIFMSKLSLLAFVILFSNMSCR